MLNLSDAAATDAEDLILRARTQSALGQYSNALATLDALAENDLARELSAQVAMTLWWKGGDEEMDPEACLGYAEHAVESLATKKIYQSFAHWARQTSPIDPNSMLPDFMNLRTFATKSDLTDSGELDRQGLGEAERVLKELLELDPAWENFDTIYTLSLVYMVTGRQNLAEFTRYRAWEMHADGNRSRVPGATELPDVKLQTVFRQPRARVMVAVRVVRDEYREVIERQYKARRAYAIEWLEARDEFVERRLANGVDATSSDFWDGFVSPTAEFPSMDFPSTPAVASETTKPSAKTEQPDAAPAAAPPAAEQPVQDEVKDEGSRTVTWITLGALIGVLALGGFAKARMDASAKRTQTDEEPTP